MKQSSEVKFFIVILKTLELEVNNFFGDESSETFLVVKIHRIDSRISTLNHYLQFSFLTHFPKSFSLLRNFYIKLNYTWKILKNCNNDFWSSTDLNFRITSENSPILSLKKKKKILNNPCKSTEKPRLTLP